MKQVYSTRPRQLSIGNATVLYSGHVVLLNFSKEFWRYPIDPGHTFMGPLPLSASDAEQDHIFNNCNDDNSGKVPGSVILFCNELLATDQKWKRYITGHTSWSVRTNHFRIEVQCWKRAGGCSHEEKWKFYPGVLSYNCDIPQGKTCPD